MTSKCIQPPGLTSERSHINMIPLNDGSTLNIVLIAGWEEDKIRKLVKKQYIEVLEARGIFKKTP